LVRADHRKCDVAAQGPGHPPVAGCVGLSKHSYAGKEAPDVILANGTLSVMALQQVTRMMPMLMSPIGTAVS